MGAAVGIEEVRQLLDERAITRVLLRYCHAVDRMDERLLLSVCHEGAVTHHPPLFDGPWPGFVAALASVAAASERWVHVLSNVLIELDGDAARAQSYFSSVTRSSSPRGTRDFLLLGRYLDVFQRRQGRWAIVERTVSSDLWRVDPVADSRWPPRSAPPPLVGTRTADDPASAWLSRW